MSERENGMSKQIKERVQIGQDKNGKPIYKWATGYSRQEVLLNAGRLITEYNLSSIQGKQRQESPFFKEYAKTWLCLYKENIIRHTTSSEYNSLLNKHIIPAFGDKHISEITIDLVQAFMNEKKTYAKKSIAEMKMVLGMVLDGAVEDGYITRNPAKSHRLKIPSQKKADRIALTEKQASDVILHLPNLDQSRDQRFLALLIFTGMRRGEVLGLRWTDIDADGMRIYVHNAITFKGNVAVEGPTKTAKGTRLIPLNPDLLPWLTHTQENQEFVILDKLSQQTVKCMWKRIQSQINVYGATPHCFRHTFATICHRKGMDEKTLQAIGGWADLETMRDIYTHTQKKDISKAAEVMKSMFQCPCDTICDKPDIP